MAARARLALRVALGARHRALHASRAAPHPTDPNVPRDTPAADAKEGAAEDLALRLYSEVSRKEEKSRTGAQGGENGAPHWLSDVPRAARPWRGDVPGVPGSAHTAEAMAPLVESRAPLWRSRAALRKQLAKLSMLANSLVPADDGAGAQSPEARAEFVELRASRMELQAEITALLERWEARGVLEIHELSALVDARRTMKAELAALLELEDDPHAQGGAMDSRALDPNEALLRYLKRQKKARRGRRKSKGTGGSAEVQGGGKGRGQGVPHAARADLQGPVEKTRRMMDALAEMLGSPRKERSETEREREERELSERVMVSESVERGREKRERWREVVMEWNESVSVRDWMEREREEENKGTGGRKVSEDGHPVGRGDV